MTMMISPAVVEEADSKDLVQTFFGVVLLFLMLLLVMPDLGMAKLVPEEEEEEDAVYKMATG